MRVIFPGSFDPVTLGHLDLIRRLAAVAESVVVAVAINPEKRPLFDEPTRVAMLRDACSPWPHVEVRAFRGLVVDAAREVRADVIARGVRGAADVERELPMAVANRTLSGIDTVLLPASGDLAHISATLVREIARFGGDVSAFVPEGVAARMRTRHVDEPSSQS
jgi:pantetheine-phosphate adenylyltransferase